MTEACYVLRAGGAWRDFQVVKVLCAQQKVVLDPKCFEAFWGEVAAASLWEVDLQTNGWDYVHKGMGRYCWSARFERYMDDYRSIHG